MTDSAACRQSWAVGKQPNDVAFKTIGENCYENDYLERWLRGDLKGDGRLIAGVSMSGALEHRAHDCQRGAQIVVNIGERRQLERSIKNDFARLSRHRFKC